MKLQQFSVLTVLSLSLMLFSCEKDDVIPLPDSKPPIANPGNGSPNPTPAPTPGNGTPPSTPNPTPPPPVTTNSLLTQMGGRVLKYDAQNRLEKVDFPMQPYLGFSIVYEGNKPVRINRDSGGWLIYVYNGEKVAEVISYYSYNGENLVNYHYKFEYNGDRLVKRTTMSYARSDEGQYGENKMLYDANGNMIEMEIRWSTSNRVEDLAQPSYIRWANFDSKPNPMPYIEGDVYLPGIMHFQNNPGYRDPGSGKEFYSYLYHDSGMPKQRYTTLEAYPHIPAIIDMYTYQ